MTGDLQIKCPSHRAERKRYVRQWERKPRPRGRDGTAVLRSDILSASSPAASFTTHGVAGRYPRSAKLCFGVCLLHRLLNGLNWEPRHEHTDQTNQTPLRDHHLHDGRDLRRFHRCRLRPCGRQCSFRKIIGKIRRHEPSPCTGKDRPGGHRERSEPRHGKRLRDGQRRQRPLDPGGTKS